MRVVVMEDYQRAVGRLDAFGLLDGHEVVVQSVRPETVAERAAQIGDAEALVLIRERTPIDAPLLALLPSLRLICQTGRGMPHIDLEACTRRGIAVCTGSGSPYAPAELTLALILASTRCIVADAVAFRAGSAGRRRRPGAARPHARDRRLRQHRRARRRVRTGARHARARLGTRGVARAGHRRRVRGRAGSRRALRALGRRQRASQADAGDAWDRDGPAPLVDEAGRALRQHGPGRAGRAGALAAALAGGRPGSAAVDVFDDEPATGDPLVASAAVLATPHLGYVTWETYETLLPRGVRPGRTHSRPGRRSASSTPRCSRQRLEPRRPLGRARSVRVGGGPGARAARVASTSRPIWATSSSSEAKTPSSRSRSHTSTTSRLP